MNMKCAICGSDKFHLDIENQTVSCSACSFYCDFKALVRGNAAPQAQPAPQRPAYNPADFEIVSGVLKKYKGAAVDVVVPDGVIEIGADSFKSQKYLRSVRLPWGVKLIGMQAFYGCDNLLSVELPDTLETIANEAFGMCMKLKHISLPNGLRSIGGRAFCWCKSLESIVIPESVENIHTTNIHWGSGSRDVDRCFDGCDSLVNITYPKDRFTIHKFYGSLYFRRDPIGQSVLIREKKCPDCNGQLGMFKKCKSCGKAW